MAGATIAFLCIVVTLGTSTPLSVAVKSKTEEGCGVKVPIPILFCEKPIVVETTTSKKATIDFLNILNFY